MDLFCQDTFIILLGVLLIYLLIFSSGTAHGNIIKNTSVIETVEAIDTADETQIEEFIKIPNKYKTVKNLTSNTTFKSYNLEEIDNIAKFLLKILNGTDGENCYKLIEIHRVKKEVDTNDILAYSLDMFIFDTINNFGTLIRGVVYEISGKYKLREMKQITPIPMSTTVDEGFSFEPITQFMGPDGISSEPEFSTVGDTS